MNFGKKSGDCNLPTGMYLHWNLCEPKLGTGMLLHLDLHADI